jgi:ChrR Cupin-like domain
MGVKMKIDRSVVLDIPDDVLGTMLASVVPVKMPQSTADRIFRKIIKRSTEGDLGFLRTSRLDDDWLDFAEGVQKKTLFDDGTTESWLVRMTKGARLAAHPHPGNEECFLLSGSVFLGDVQLFPGDYQVAGKGSSHGEVYSPTGCIMFVRSPSTKPAAVVVSTGRQ